MRSRRHPYNPVAHAMLLMALGRPHNLEPTPYLPRSVARIRAATYDPNSIKRKPLDFRSNRSRK